MTVENTSFSGQRAPCGGIMDGERHDDGQLIAPVVLHFTAYSSPFTRRLGCRP